MASQSIGSVESYPTVMMSFQN